MCCRIDSLKMFSAREKNDITLQGHLSICFAASFLGGHLENHVQRTRSPQEMPWLKNWLTLPRHVLSERAKGGAKASCRETVVQKGVSAESVSSLPP